MFRTGTHAHGRPTRASDDAGFTMIEAIVSFTIFAVVIAAAVLAIVAGTKTANDNRDRVAAANVAQQALNRAQAAPATSLAASPTATSTSTVGKEPYTVVRKIDYAQASATATGTATACPTVITNGTSYWMHIAVTVTWPGAAGRSVQLDTVRSC